MPDRFAKRMLGGAGSAPSGIALPYPLTTLDPTDRLIGDWRFVEGVSKEHVMTPAKLFAFAAFVTLPCGMFGADAATAAGPAETAKRLRSPKILRRFSRSAARNAIAKGRSRPCRW